MLLSHSPKLHVGLEVAIDVVGEFGPSVLFPVHSNINELGLFISLNKWP